MLLNMLKSSPAIIICLNDHHLNPWRFGHFSPRWFEINQGIQWAPLWVSRLDADSEENTIALIGRAVMTTWTILMSNYRQRVLLF